MPEEVTDPDLLKQLNAPESKSGQEVTDPALLEQLNAPAQGQGFWQGAWNLAKQFPAGMARGAMDVAPLGEAQLQMENLTNLPAPKVSDYRPTAEKALPEPKTAGERIVSAAGEAVPTSLALGPPSIAGIAIPAVVSALGQATQEAVPGPWSHTAGSAVALIGGVAAGRGIGAIRSLAGAETSATARLGRALARDNDAPAALLQRLQEARQVRPDATLADVGGNNVRGLLEGIAQTPGAGRTTVIPAMAERQRAQMSRISQDLAGVTGDTRSAFRATEEVMAQRQAAATPLYQRAYADGDFAVWSPELERLTGAPFVQAAMRKAVSTWRNQAIADGYGAMNPGAVVEAGGQLRFLSGRVPVFPNVQFWDYTKRMLDDQISTAIRAGQNQKARTLTTLVTALRNNLDQQVPSYAAARNSWSGPSRYLDAIEDGRSILSKNITAEELHANLANLSEGEREGFRLGAFSAIRNRMGSDPARMGDMTKYLRAPETRAKLNALMPTPEAAQRFNRALDYEIHSSELTRGTLGGSQTAFRQAAQDEADGIWGELVMHGLTHGTSLGFARRAWNTIGKPIRDTLRSRSDSILAELLTATQPVAPSRLTPPPTRSNIMPIIQGLAGFKGGGRVVKSFRYRT